MIFFEKKDNNGELLTNIVNNFHSDNYKKRVIEIDTSRYTFYTNDKDLVKSNRMFSKVSKVLVNYTETVIADFLKKIDVHLHTLKKLHAQLLQKVETVVPDPKTTKVYGYTAQKDAILEKIKENPEFIAETLLFLNKRIFEVGTNMKSFEILYMGRHLHIDRRPHNIKNIIVGIWHGFDDISSSKNISCNFNIEDKIADNNQISLDYQTINTAMYNFFDNALKYMSPNSSINFYLDISEANFVLSAEMYSLKIDEDETEKIFLHGFRSKSATELFDGNGIGLYIAKKSLELNEISVKIVPNNNEFHIEDGIKYYLNKFVFEGHII